MTAPASIIFQSAKLGDIPQILKEFDWARQLLKQETKVGRVYGLSGGALTALAFGLTLAAQQSPGQWGKSNACLETFAHYLENAQSRSLHGRNLNPWYGPYNLKPLRAWVARLLRTCVGRDNLLISELPVALYLCAMDRDGLFTMFGPPDDHLQFQYQFVQIGPPQDAPVLDALTASLSTILSTAPVMVNGLWFKDCRPAIVDGGAIVSDLEVEDPRPILRYHPYAPIRSWKLNFITSPFIMHSQHERNQALLAAYYLDLTSRQQSLQSQAQSLPAAAQAVQSPGVYHIQIPYVGSTEAVTNMRQSVEHKDELVAKFEGLLAGQLDSIPFDQPCNVIYGAGGFSGILGGLVTTRGINAQLSARGGQVHQIYGVSAGVLNGFFHAVQLAASLHPDIYQAPAQNALGDLENFIASIAPGKFAKTNTNPLRFWQGFANLGPFEAFILDRLSAYTGSSHPEQITFDDIGLPLTVTAARGDGFTDFMGMTSLNRRMYFGGREWQVRPAPVAKAIMAGWSMNSYIQPTFLNGEYYRDGGGTFYDVGLFTAMLDPQLINLVNIHLDEPEGHSYGLPPRPGLLRIIFDTHNYNFPEERRRMYMVTNLLYAHYRSRAELAARLAQAPQDGSSPVSLPSDFRQNWRLAKSA